MNDLERAYLFLEIDAARVARAPKVSHLFKHLEGGEDLVWESLAGSESADAQRLMEFRRRLNEKEFGAVPFEAIAIAAGMTTKHAFGVVSEAIVEHSQEASKLILHAAAPAIMQRAVDTAKESGGSEGKMLLQAMNLVPRPRNTFTVVHGDVVKGNKNQVAVLPSSEDTGRRLSNRFNMEMTVPATTIAPAFEEDPDAEDPEE